jgi:hypothetical protein
MSFLEKTDIISYIAYYHTMFEMYYETNFINLLSDLTDKIDIHIKSCVVIIYIFIDMYRYKQFINKKLEYFQEQIDMIDVNFEQKHENIENKINKINTYLSKFRHVVNC